MLRSAVSALLALLLAACATPHGPMHDESVLGARLERYRTLVLAMDHAGIAGLFAEDGELEAPGRDALRGRAAIEEYLRGFAGYEVLSYELVPDSTVIEGDRAVQTGGYRQRVRIPDGKLVEVSGTFRVEWERAARGRWLIRRMGTAAVR